MNEFEAASLLLDAWKFRQSHCWRSLQTFIVAATAVSIVPYILDKEKARLLGSILYGFPILGGLIALAAAWHYAAEYVRCQCINIELKRILEKSGYLPKLKTPWLLKPKIGWTTVGFITGTSIILSLLNCMAVSRVIPH